MTCGIWIDEGKGMTFAYQDQKNKSENKSKQIKHL
jgi:hypothetical protein